MARMKEENKLGLVIAYYLSKFDNLAYERLGFGSMTGTHEQVGSILGVKGNTIKNMRDEFDPLHPNSRQGWYQRELRASRLDIVHKYSKYSEKELFEHVDAILHPSQRVQNIFDGIDDEEMSRKDQQIIEGTVLEKKLMLYKRNQKSTKLCKERDGYSCQGCGFSYQDSIVECHHIYPLSMVKESVVDMDNLLTLCPTCHKLAHLFLREDYDKYTDRDALLAKLRGIKQSLSS